MLWVAFVVVHAGVALLGYYMPNAPMGDVYLVYEPWSGCALFGGAQCTLSGGSWALPGVTSAWVYPQLALIPMLLAWLFAWAVSYTPAWALVVTLANAAAFAVLIGRGRSKGRTVAAGFWLAFIAALGPIGMFRLDGFTVPLVLAGALWLIGRPWLGAILLTVAAWMKVWPAAILAAAVIAVRRRLALVGGALAVTGVTITTIVLLGGAAFALGFVGDQAGRGLQLEAPVSAVYLWRAVVEARDSYVYYDTEMLTFQVTGPYVDQVIAIMTPLLALAVGAVAALGALKAWRGASYVRLFPPLALALVLALIVVNKVGSPQYIGWIAAPLTVGLVLDRRRWVKPAMLGLAIALLTQLVYPLGYGGLMLKYPLPLPALILTARNVLLIALFVWSVTRLVRVPGRAIAHASRRFGAVKTVGMPRDAGATN